MLANVQWTNRNLSHLNSQMTGEALTYTFRSIIYWHYLCRLALNLSLSGMAIIYETHSLSLSLSPSCAGVASCRYRMDPNDFNVQCHTIFIQLVVHHISVSALTYIYIYRVRKWPTTVLTPLKCRQISKHTHTHSRIDHKFNTLCICLHWNCRIIVYWYRDVLSHKIHLSLHLHFTKLISLQASRHLIYANIS